MDDFKRTVAEAKKAKAERDEAERRAKEEAEARRRDEFNSAAQELLTRIEPLLTAAAEACKESGYPAVIVRKTDPNVALASRDGPQLLFFISDSSTMTRSDELRFTVDGERVLMYYSGEAPRHVVEKGNEKVAVNEGLRKVLKSFDRSPRR